MFTADHTTLMSRRQNGHMTHVLARRRETTIHVINGTGAAPGTHIGTVRVMNPHRDAAAIEPGDVLLCAAGTRDEALPLSKAGALIFEGGGILSNPVIVARECGIPTVVATGNAATFIRDGQRVLVDGDHGIVRVLA